jgi:hypothetical protein
MNDDPVGSCRGHSAPTCAPDTSVMTWEVTP